MLPDGNEMTRERYSIPYFVQADREKIVKCVPGLGGEANYPPIVARDYLAMRSNATYKV